MKRVHAGDRFVATKDTPTLSLTGWNAPATFGFETVIPEGTVLVAPRAAFAGAPGFACIPERYDELEILLVPEEDRLAPRYSGYYFVLLRADIGDTLRRL